MSIDVAGNNGKSHKFEIDVVPTVKGYKYEIPDGLDIKCRSAVPNPFDAEFSSKKMKR